MNRQIPFAVAATLAACSAEPKPLGLDSIADAGVTARDAAPPDAGPADLGSPDSGVPPDIGPDAGRVDRELTTLLPLGDTPVENLVLSPTLDGFSAVGPRSLRGQLLPRLFLRSTPTRAPAMQVPAQDGLFLLSQSHGPRLRVEVWIGFALGQSVDVPVGFVGVVESGDERLVPLEVDVESTTTLEGVEWRRFAITIEERIYGTSALIVQNESNRALLVSGPTVVTETNGILPDRRYASAPVGRLRPLDGRWQGAVRRIGEWSRRHARENLQAPNLERKWRGGPRSPTPPR